MPAVKGDIKSEEDHGKPKPDLRVRIRMDSGGQLYRKVQFILLLSFLAIAAAVPQAIYWSACCGYTNS